MPTLSGTSISISDHSMVPFLLGGSTGEISFKCKNIYVNIKIIYYTMFRVLDVWKKC